jgi:hypothetical protein
MCRESATVCLIKSPVRQHGATGSLATRLQLLPCSAVVPGACSFAAIGQWARNAPRDTLARLGTRTTTAFGARLAPSAATIRRLINRACPGRLADPLGHDPAGTNTLAVDGRSARGSHHASCPRSSHGPSGGTRGRVRRRG